MSEEQAEVTLEETLDEAITMLDNPGDETEGDGPTDEPQADPEETSDEAPEEKATEPYDKFAKTGNPNDLPDGSRERVLSLMGEFTRRSQKLAQYEKGEVKSEEDQAPDEPEIDLDADEETLKKQIGDYAAYHARQAVEDNSKEVQERLNKHEQIFSEVERDAVAQEQVDAITAMENHIRGLDGYTEDIEAKMEEIAEADSEWSQVLLTKIGREALFDKAKGMVGGVAPPRTTPRNNDFNKKSTPAVPVNPGREYKGLAADDKFNKAFNSGWDEGN